MWIRPGHCESDPLIAPKGNIVIRSPLFCRSLALALLLVIPSCSRQSPLTTQPEVDNSAMRADAGIARSQLGREPGDFYPLAVGNQWTYEVKLVQVRVAADGSETLLGESAYPLELSIECTTQIEGHEWFIERIHHMTAGIEPKFRALRQDRDGLHALERLHSTDPCGSVPSLDGTLPVQELRYPLRPGVTWTMDDDRFAFGPTIATVEAHEVIVTPAGRFPTVRIRVERARPAVSPTTTEHRWYGRQGLIAIEVRTEAAIGGLPGAISRFITSVRLTSLHQTGSLARRIPRTSPGALIAQVGSR